MTVLTGVLAAAVGLYLAVLAAMYVFQRQLLYRPDAGPIEIRSVDLPAPEVIDQTAADGVTTRSWYWPATTDQAVTLVYFHGNAGHIGHRVDKIDAYVKAGLGVMLVGYRGFGGNPGRPTEAGLYADARAALAVLAARGVAGDRLLAYGESLGSGVAVQMATERRLAALVLEAPLSSVVDVARARYWFLPVAGLVIDRFDNMAKIPAVTAPLLVLHGEADAVVAFRFGRRLFAAAREPKRLIAVPAAMHNDLYDHGAAGMVLGFLRQHGLH